MRHHAIDPAAYLEEVHEIDFSVLTPDPRLAAAIAALPGRKIVYANGTRPYAERVMSLIVDWARYLMPSTALNTQA